MQIVVFLLAALGVVAVTSGAWIAGRPMFLSKQDAQEVAGPYYGDATFEENPTAQALYEQGRATRKGLVLMTAGAALEVIALLLQIVSSG